jgi:hypothetical protein
VQVKSNRRYCKDAPAFLIEYFEKSEGNLSKNILKELLSHDSMDQVWKRLGRHYKSDVEWKNLLSYILSSVKKSNDLKRSLDNGVVLQTREEISDGLVAIAANARALASSLDTYQLDVLAFDCCPNDVTQNESNLNGPLAWLSFKELLEGLADLAEAHEVNTGTTLGRINIKGNPCATEFSRRLYGYLRPKLDSKSDNIYATISTIGAIALGNDIMITGEFVKSVCRPR